MSVPKMISLSVPERIVRQLLEDLRRNSLVSDELIETLQELQIPQLANDEIVRAAILKSYEAE
jgi:hypothetical protein